MEDFSRVEHVEHVEVFEMSACPIKCVNILCASETLCLCVKTSDLLVNRIKQKGKT